jgi:hypothetical protein
MSLFLTFGRNSHLAEVTGQVAGIAHLLGTINAAIGNLKYWDWT